MADERKKPGVHIDLLEIDMTTGAHWLDPLERNRDKLDAIVARNRAKWIKEGRPPNGTRGVGQKHLNAGLVAPQPQLDTRGSKKTVVELWPEKDETREDFMGRCVTDLTKCIGAKKAPRVCATKWRKSEKLGKKDAGQAFVARGLDDTDVIEACGETCVGCKGADAPFTPQE